MNFLGRKIHFSTTFQLVQFLIGISNADSEISSEELINGSNKIANYFDMPDEYQDYIHKFVQKYWYLVDQDNSGSLNFDEYK